MEAQVNSSMIPIKNMAYLLMKLVHDQILLISISINENTT